MLASVLALMVAVAIPALANEDDGAPSGSQSISQSQEAAILQYTSGDGAQQEASLILGDQSASQGQYDSGEQSIEQSQSAAVSQYAAGDDAEQSAAVELGSQSAAQNQYGSETPEDD